jgi:hypothetical protein
MRFQKRHPAAKRELGAHASRSLVRQRARPSSLNTSSFVFFASNAFSCGKAAQIFHDLFFRVNRKSQIVNG